jgi:hypothetical protein
MQGFSRATVKNRLFARLFGGIKIVLNILVKRLRNISLVEEKSGCGIVIAF